MKRNEEALALQMMPSRHQAIAHWKEPESVNADKRDIKDKRTHYRPEMEAGIR